MPPTTLPVMTVRTPFPGDRFSFFLWGPVTILWLCTGAGDHLSVDSLKTFLIFRIGPLYSNRYYFNYLPLGFYFQSVDGGVSYSEELDEDSELADDSDESD